jgi:histidine triad (HIT) family protein
VSNVFARIIRGEVPSDVVYQDELVTAFRDIAPRTPVHVLIVPNKTIATVNDIAPEDEPMVGHMLRVAGMVARSEGIADDGYRLIINCNRHGGQEIDHLHMHLMGGRPLGAMLPRHE